jgi:hypothetical protein
MRKVVVYRTQSGEFAVVHADKAAALQDARGRDADHAIVLDETDSN